MKTDMLLVGCSLIGLAGLAGCSTVPEPRLAYEDSLTRIEWRFDKQADQGHSHPATLTADQLAAMLSGIRVHRTGVLIYSRIMGSPDAVPAFSPSTVYAMAGPLGEALAKASPNEIVTFYRRISDATVGLAYTTGGLYMENGLMYIIVANHRVQPMDAAVGAVPVYATDPVKDPLLSLGNARYTLSFSRPEAEVKSLDGIGRHDPYRTIVLNPTLAQKTLSNSQPAAP